MLNTFRYSLPDEIQSQVTATLAEWNDASKVNRIWSRDASVWTNDDEAKWLTGERQSTSKGPQPRSTTSPRRLAAVGKDDDELPLGEDAIGLVSEAPAEEPTEDLTATAASVRGTGDADWIATQASDRPAPVELGSESDPDVADVEPDPAPAAPSAAEQADQAEDETPRRTAKKKSRASVPSWDEIMFGGGKRE